MQLPCPVVWLLHGSQKVMCGFHDRLLETVVLLRSKTFGNKDFRFEVRHYFESELRPLDILVKLLKFFKIIAYETGFFWGGWVWFGSLLSCLTGAMIPADLFFFWGGGLTSP